MAKKKTVSLQESVHWKTEEIKKRVVSSIKRSIADGKTISEASNKIMRMYSAGGFVDNAKIAERISQLADLKIVGIKFDDKLLNEIKSLSRRIKKQKTVALRSAYSNLLKSIKSGTNKQIKDNLKITLREKTLYMARQIAQTESAKEYYKVLERKAVENPKVFGVKATLSPSHIITDICDVHAKMNLGYGPGVYPLSKLPTYPLHTNCRCRLQPISIDKISRKIAITKKLIDESMKNYLSTLPDSDLIKLLGNDGYNKYLETGKWDDLRNYSGFHNANNT